MPKAAGKKRNGAAHGSSPYSHAGKGSAANHIFKMKTVRPNLESRDMSCELLLPKHVPRLYVLSRKGNTDREIVIQDIGQHVLKVCLRSSVENQNLGFLKLSFKNPGVAQAIGTHLRSAISQAGMFILERGY